MVLVVGSECVCLCEYVCFCFICILINYVSSVCVCLMPTSQEKQYFSKLPQLFPLILPFFQVSQPLAPYDHMVRVYFDVILN